MKIKRILPTLTLLTILASPVIVLAQNVPAPPLSLDALIAVLRPVIWTVFGFIVLICFVYAGIIFLTAGGDPDKIAKARSAFMYGVVGVVVGVIAYGILAIISAIIT